MSDKELGLGPNSRAEEWLAAERSRPEAAERAWQALSRGERLRLVLSARGKERERLITLSADSGALIRNLAPEEFARTVLELGPEDSTGLLAECDDDQLSYLLDLTGWVKERFAPARYEAWLPLLLEAGSKRLLRWLKVTDLEVLALLFAHWFQVVKFLASQDEQEPPDDLPAFTLDGVYFIDIREQAKAGFVAQVLVLLQSELPQRYYEVLEAMLWESAAALADDGARWRLGRLADHGFPDRREALELWARPVPGETDWQGLKEKLELRFMAGTPLRSDRVAGLLPEDETLPVVARALSGPARDILRAELAYVANCGVVALGADPVSPEDVDKAAAESLGLVNLGLGIVSEGDQERAAAIVTRLGLASLARAGAQAIRELNLGAHKLVHEGWLKGLPNGLHILDYPLDRRLAGLIFPRPRFWDPNLAGGREYRAFHNLGDLEQSRRALEQAEFWGELFFELIGIQREEVLAILAAEAFPEDPLEIKITRLLGTWLARRALNLPGLSPIPRESLLPALEALQKGLGGPLGRELAESCRALADPGKAALAGELLRGVLGELERELARINLAGEVDPALIGGLVVER